MLPFPAIGVTTGICKVSASAVSSCQASESMSAAARKQDGFFGPRQKSEALLDIVGQGRATDRIHLQEGFFGVNVRRGTKRLVEPVGRDAEIGRTRHATHGRAHHGSQHVRNSLRLRQISRLFGHRRKRWRSAPVPDTRNDSAYSCSSCRLMAISGLDAQYASIIEAGRYVAPGPYCTMPKVGLPVTRA